MSPSATTLPADGRKGPIPALGRKHRGSWHAATREWWEAVWRSPMATQFLDVHVFSLRVLAKLIDEAHQGRAKTSTYAEIRHWEDRFGLSPEGMRRLSWTVAAGPIVEIPTARSRPNARRLHAV